MKVSGSKMASGQGVLGSNHRIHRKIFKNHLLERLGQMLEI